ncbi:MAG TPA: PEP-CTERM sorting domain-containing protein [Candidatus Saccharimonadales bacterium]|nr:PEP-CTERM sorting domain-containing protein [Candidatus Saccharimonadales bacterium]
MTKILTTLLYSSLIATSAPLDGQGTFQNLDFEQAQLIFPPNDSTQVFAADALPGWTVYEGTNQLSLVFYNYAPNSPAAGLFGPGSSLVLDGNYSAFVNGDTVSQTGLIPADAASLLFDLRPGWFAPALHVSLNGQDLSYRTTQDGLLGADISAFAGQTATLTFSGFGLFDDIQFSSELIPEPSPSWLLFLGSGVWFYVRHRGQTVKS